MIRSGKCPKCETTVRAVKIEAIDVKESVVGPARWKGVSYCCTSCSTVLSVSVDPFALKADIVKEVARAMKGK